MSQDLSCWRVSKLILFTVEMELQRMLTPLLFYVQVNKLVDAGAEVLSAVTVGPQNNIGTIVDYVTHIHSQVNGCILCTYLFTDHISDH